MNEWRDNPTLCGGICCPVVSEYVISFTYIYIDMKYSVSKDRVMEVMDKFFNEEYPNIELPLVRERKTSKGNRGYGSGLDDYTYVTTYYHSANYLNDSLFIEWDDAQDFSDTKWDVHEMFEKLYNFFGVIMFEDFIKWKFGLDITVKGNKEFNWGFV